MLLEAVELEVAVEVELEVVEVEVEVVEVEVEVEVVLNKKLTTIVVIPNSSGVGVTNVAYACKRVPRRGPSSGVLIVCLFREVVSPSTL